MTFRKVRAFVLGPLLFPMALLGMVLCLAVVPAHAQTIQDITLTIDDPTQIVQPTSTTTYTGTITNNTGAALDIYGDFVVLNFSGYGSLTDPTSLVGIIGMPPGPEFVIPVGGTSPDFDIFTDALGPDAPLGSYPVQLQLSDIGPDVSNIVTVTEIVTPEPTTWSFGLIGLALFFLWRFRGLLSQKFRGAARAAVVLSLFALLFWASPGYGQAPAFVAGSPGASLFAPNLNVAVPLVNDGTADAASVQVTSITSPGATLTSPAAFPVLLGTISADGGAAPVLASFTSAAFAPNGTYLITIRGTYLVSGTTAPVLNFAVNKFVTIPAASPGSAQLMTVTIAPNFNDGYPYPAFLPNFTEEVNTPRWFVPTGPFNQGPPPMGGTGLQAAPQGAPGNNFCVDCIAEVPGDAPVSFILNNSLGLPSGGYDGVTSTVAEPSGDTNGGTTAGGNVVFATANWDAAYATDGGFSFSGLDPTTIFPNDVVGFCCDQVVQYVPSIDRFIWVLQGNGYRLASASPAQVAATHGTAWTYWNLPPSVFGNNGGFDYPQVSVGDTYLYISWDAGLGCTNCDWGHQVVRIPLKEIAANASIGLGFTDPMYGRDAWGTGLSQDTGGVIYWAGQDDTSHLRVFSMPEAGNTYSWNEVNVHSWSNNIVSSTTPDGVDWLTKLMNFPGSAAIGSTVTNNGNGNQVWFAWTAGTDNNFSQNHIEMVEINTSNFSLVQQVQIWNPGFAFAYASLATNGCSGEVGLSLETGGGGNYENHAVGFWGDFVVYRTTNSSLGVSRFGDYNTIRQDPALFGEFAPSYFDALGYGVSAGPTNDVHYTVFGRSNYCVLE